MPDYGALVLFLSWKHLWVSIDCFANTSCHEVVFTRVHEFTFRSSSQEEFSVPGNSLVILCQFPPISYMEYDVPPEDICRKL